MVRCCGLIRPPNCSPSKQIRSTRLTAPHLRPPCRSVWETDPTFQREVAAADSVSPQRRSGLLSRVREVVGYAVDAGDMRANSAVARMKPNGRCLPFSVGVPMRLARRGSPRCVWEDRGKVPARPVPMRA
jgi:hypothetical protein